MLLQKTNRFFSGFVTVLSTSVFVDVDKAKTTSRRFLQGKATFYCFSSEMFGYLRRCKNDILFNATHNCYSHCLEQKAFSQNYHFYAQCVSLKLYISNLISSDCIKKQF